MPQLNMKSFLADVKPPKLTGNLNEALYTMDEHHLWHDEIDNVSPEQAILCWRLVEKMRTTEFPEELRV